MSISLKIEDKEVTLDENQYKIFKSLEDIIQQHSAKSSFLQKIFPFFYRKKNINIHQGIYICGRPGRGKSMLLKYFFNSFPDKNKAYYHFNDFMQKIHRELYKSRQDPANKDQLIEIVTKNIIQNNKLICLDEFQVDDVTDALILRRIFSYIFAKNIIVVFTSNSKPENLYQDGLQRDLFLKFINETLKKYCQIYNLDSEIDYRERFLHKVKQHYFYPINQTNDKKIANILQHLLRKNQTYEEKITILGRDLIIKKAYDNIAIFDFKELCFANLGVVDYQKICEKYNIIFLLNIPKLTKEDRNFAKRFILFIDEVYEKKVKLLITAEVKIEEIYEEGKDAEKFQRTISRLKEIT